MTFCIVTVVVAIVGFLIGYYGIKYWPKEFTDREEQLQREIKTLKKRGDRAINQVWTEKEVASKVRKHAAMKRGEG